MSEPSTAYVVTLAAEPEVDTSLASWIQYQALRCRELALELEVAAGHLVLSGLADNADAMIGIRDTANRLKARSVAIAKHCTSKRKGRTP